MAEHEVDPAAMAADADSLGRAAADAVGAVHGLVTARRAAGAFGSSPAAEAFRDVCDAWLHGIDTIAWHVDRIARSTREAADAFVDADATLPSILVDRTAPPPPVHDRNLA